MERSIATIFRAINFIYQKTPLRYIPIGNILINGLLLSYVKLIAKIKKITLAKDESWRTKIRFLHNWFEPHTTKIVKLITQPGMHIVDVGANMGYFTRLFSNSAGPTGHVWAFEPNPEMFKILQKNIKQKNITLVQSALFDKNSKLEFFTMRAPAKSSLMKVHTTLNTFRPKDYKLKKKIIVKTIVFDDFAKKNNISKINLIKIDVEGAELNVLSGMKNIIAKNKDIYLIIEFNPNTLKSAEVKEGELIQTLRQLGFAYIIAINERENHLYVVGDISYKPRQDHTNLLCCKFDNKKNFEKLNKYFTISKI